MTDLVQGGMFSVMVVRVDDPSDPNFEGQLAEHVARSSAFFANAPVVLDIEHCEGLATVDQFQRLKALFKRQHMVAIGVQHGNRTQVRAAMNADLACFPPASVQRRAEGVDQPAPRPAAPVASSGPAVPKAPPPPGGGRTKLVTQPVRSGTQVYARGGDLVVTNQVGAGAEVIADGHLHIYGVLRGRAIAGATGDREARIFVDRLEAELVCIAGHYLVSDAIAEQHRGKTVQIALVADQLVITPA